MPTPDPPTDAQPTGATVLANPLTLLLRLRGRALLRRLRLHALPLLVLGPLVGGTGALLLSRIAGDLTEQLTVPPAAGWLGWAVAIGLAFTLVRSAGPVADDFTEWMPLSRGCLWADRVVAAWFRLMPLMVVMAVIIPAVGGGGRDWGILLAIWWGLPLLVRHAAPSGGSGGRFRRRLAQPLVWALSRLSSASLRPLVVRDLLRLTRGLSLRQGGYVAVAGVAWLAGVSQLLQPTELSGRLGMLATLVMAWAVAASLSTLTENERICCLPELDAALSADTLWWAKAITATLLGAVAGLVSGLLWWSQPSLAVLHVGIGAATGLCTGATLMEGDRRPLLHGVVSLLLSLMVGTLAMLHPALLLLAPATASYLAQVGIPRLALCLTEDAINL